MRAATPQDSAETTFDPVRTHATLRFAFGVTLALVISELLQWVPTFLAPVLVAILLVNVPVRLPPRLAIGFFLIVTVAALVALLLSTALLPTPPILFGAAALVVFRGLYAIAEGRPRLPPLLLLICVTTIPVVALESSQIAGLFAFALVRATALAILIVWLVHLLWPRVRAPGAAAAVAPLPANTRLRSALLGTAVLAPLMLVYLLFGLANALPVLVATTMIMVNLDFRRGRLQAMALVAGNVAGGFVALVLFLLLQMQASIVLFTVLVALAALAYGWRISAGGPLAAVLVVACNATLIVFTSSLLSGQGTFDVWMTRLTQFIIAGAFAVGMMTLLWPARQPGPESGLPATVPTGP